MKTPTSLAGWCTVLFFLFAGLGAFVTIPFGATLTGIFALGAAIFTLMGR
ncbi:MAG: hypothetical protein HY863_06705 [Chloroflexi bacterium]|nr:hypothetical protein [Chloroflexota bacterium]